ncbi:MAG: nuclear transport factor 2 family protein [Candidatus Binatia bacterium]|nr:nuclear transport factor 2 family protein [Candidatus Binatia bacterium]
MNAENERIVTAFCRSLLDADMAKTVEYLAEDVHYHNIPWKPVTGRAAVRQLLDPLVHGANCAITKMDIKHTASCGNVVMNERVETWVKGSVKIDLPVFGVFELENGKITHWRDYFDSGTIQPLMDALKNA